VAATTSSDKLAVFSNYGATSVDLGAPGVSILSTTLNDSYGTGSGTSLAAAYVTGAVALAASYRPDASIAEIKAAILDGTDSLASLSGMTVSGGRLNVDNMLHELGLVVLSSNSGDSLSDSVLLGDVTAGGDVSETDVSGSIDTAGEVDTFTYSLTAGQTLTVVVDPASTLRPQVTISGPTVNYGTYAATAAGKDAVAQTLLLSESGTYTISVTGLDSTVGSYQLAVILNAAVETETHDGATNDSMEDAQSRDTLAAGALKAAVWLAGREAGLYTMADMLGL